MRVRLVLGLEGVVLIIYTLNELIQGRLKVGKETYAYFLDVQHTIVCGVMACS